MGKGLKNDAKMPEDLKHSLLRTSVLESFIASVEVLAGAVISLGAAEHMSLCTCWLQHLCANYFSSCDDKIPSKRQRKEGGLILTPRRCSQRREEVMAAVP